MKLPRNGKVVIIDDKIEDVAKLMTALSHESIPFTYYQDESAKDLPVNPLKNIRLVFLDLELQTDISTMKSKDIIGAAIMRLRRILGKNNGPYILVTWSTKYDLYGADFTKELKKEANLCIQPIANVVLKKRDIKENFDAIKDAINYQINANNSIKAMLVWESIINESAGEITNEFVNVAKLEEDMDAGLNKLLYKLANANLGEQIKKTDGNGIVSGCYSTLNYSLNDKIEQNIKAHDQGSLFNNMTEITDVHSDFIGRINSQLHIENSETDSICPGSFAFPLEISQYEGEREDLRIKILGKRYEEQIKSLFDCSIDGIMEELKKHCRYVELNITPPCDYAQDKMGMCRILPGVLIPENSEYRVMTRKGDPNSTTKKLREDKFKRIVLHKHYKRSDYSYKSNFFVELNGENYYFIFNHSYMYALPMEKVKSVRSFYRVSSTFLNDIQAKQGAHIVRNGILYL